MGGLPYNAAKKGGPRGGGPRVVARLEPRRDDVRRAAIAARQGGSGVVSDLSMRGDVEPLRLLLRLRAQADDQVHDLEEDG